MRGSHGNPFLAARVKACYAAFPNQKLCVVEDVVEDHPSKNIPGLVISKIVWGHETSNF